MLQQLFLTFRQVRRQFHLIRDDQVTKRAVASVVPLATQTHLRTRLRLGLDLHLHLLTIGECQYHLTTQQGRIQVDGHIGIHLTRMGPAPGTVLIKALETAKAPTLFAFASEQVLKER